MVEIEQSLSTSCSQRHQLVGEDVPEKSRVDFFGIFMISLDGKCDFPSELVDCLYLLSPTRGGLIHNIKLCTITSTSCH